MQGDPRIIEVLIGHARDEQTAIASYLAHHDQAERAGLPGLHTYLHALAREEMGKLQIEGLFKIDEAALNQLPGVALADLMLAGAMPLAYCQMLSTQHLRKLGELAQLRASRLNAQAPLPTVGKDLDLSFLTAGDTLSFKNY